MMSLYLHMGLNPHQLLKWILMRLEETSRNCDSFHWWTHWTSINKLADAFLQASTSLYGWCAFSNGFRFVCIPKTSLEESKGIHNYFLMCNPSLIMRFPCMGSTQFFWQTNIDYDKPLIATSSFWNEPSSSYHNNIKHWAFVHVDPENIAWNVATSIYSS